MACFCGDCGRCKAQGNAHSARLYGGKLHAEVPHPANQLAAAALEAEGVKVQRVGSYGRQPELEAGQPSSDVSHPSHYTSHPSGVECIQVTEHMTFCVGNVLKYCWRAGLKVQDGGTTEARIKDLKKAAWYLNREIERLERAKAQGKVVP